MTLLFGHPALTDKVCLWDACLRDGFEASIDIREVAIPSCLKDACGYHAAVTTGAVEVDMLVTREICYPVVDVGEGAAVSLFDVLCRVFALLADINDDALFETPKGAEVRATSPAPAAEEAAAAVQRVQTAHAAYETDMRK